MVNKKTKLPPKLTIAGVIVILLAITMVAMILVMTATQEGMDASAVFSSSGSVSGLVILGIVLIMLGQGQKKNKIEPANIGITIGIIAVLIFLLTNVMQIAGLWLFNPGSASVMLPWYIAMVANFIVPSIIIFFTWRKVEKLKMFTPAVFVVMFLFTILIAGFMVDIHTTSFPDPTAMSSQSIGIPQLVPTSAHFMLLTPRGIEDVLGWPWYNTLIRIIWTAAITLVSLFLYGKYRK